MAIVNPVFSQCYWIIQVMLVLFPAGLSSTQFWKYLLVCIPENANETFGCCYRTSNYRQQVCVVLLEVDISLSVPASHSLFKRSVWSCVTWYWSHLWWFTVKAEPVGEIKLFHSCSAACSCGLNRIKFAKVNSKA